MATSNSTDYCGSFTDDDSGIGLNYSSSNDFNSSTLTLIESSSSSILSPRPPVLTTSIEKRSDVAPLIKFASDGVVERIRPVSMKNSKNGDFILCQTNRGAYMAYRTPAIPEWIARLVEEIELREQ